MSDNMKLKVEGLSFSYDSEPVLGGIDLEVSPGEILGILGPNGSGKTTLVKCINRLLTPHQGSVMIGEEDVLSMRNHEVARYMGYVPQNSSMEFNYPTVYEIVMMGRRHFGNWRMNSTDDGAVWDAMREMDVDELAMHRFNELSSGQTQRVLMARAIAQEARVFLLDEPTSNLDIRYQIEVMESIREIVRGKGVSACAIVHDLELAMRYCDKVMMLHGGRILAAGPPEDVITPGNVSKVYGVDIVIDTNYGEPHVIVLGASGGDGTGGRVSP